MRRLILGPACALLCGCSAVANYPIIASSPPPPAPKACTPAPQSRSRIGFFAPTSDALAAVEQLTGVHPAWTIQYPEFGDSFDAVAACESSQDGATPIIQIDPYRTSVASIANGSHDGYLRSYAAAVKTFAAPVIISFGHEMNGSWYPWGFPHTRPAVFVAAWRHIVTVFAAAGVHNVTWLWTVNVGVSIARWWPGSQYVTTVGIDGYFRSPRATYRSEFASTLMQARQLTSKPVLIAETGAERDSKSAAQVATLFAGVRDDHLLGFVWFNLKGSKDWRLEDDAAALAAFRQEASSLRLS